MDLALDNLQRFICHENQPTNQQPTQQLWIKEFPYCSSTRMDLALDNLQRLICHKKPTNQPTTNPAAVDKRIPLLFFYKDGFGIR